MDCSSCTPGWTGSDCAVIVTNTSNFTASCTGFGNIITFDGLGYEHKGNGEHILFTLEYLEIQVNVVPCYQSLRCINAVAMVTPVSVVTIHAPYKDGADSTSWINREQTFARRTSFKSNGKTFTLERSSWIRFTFSSSDMVLHIRVFGRYFDLTMSVTSSTWCSNSKGLWGTCDHNSTNDLVTRDGLVIPFETVSQKFISTRFIASWKVQSEVASVFIYNNGPANEPRQKTGAGYCLRFKDTGLTTESVFSLVARDVTLEVMVKSSDFGGTVFSYSTTSTLAIVVKETIKIHYGSIEIDTLLTLQTNQWNHISLVWTKSSKILQFLLIDSNEKTQVRNFPINADQDIFQPGGILTLGYWYPSPVPMGRTIPGAFVGEIDQLRIWNTRKSVSDIIRYRTVNIDCNARNLANLWRFNEGQGDIATDCTSSVSFHFPIYAQGPIWVYSSAPVALTTILEASVTITERTSAESLCNGLLFGGTYGKPCSSLPMSIKRFYTLGCYELDLAGGESEERVWSIFAFLDYCRVFLGRNEWPGETYCSGLTDTKLPAWVRLPCGEDCAFGTIHKKKCECRSGFFGKECSHQCPGGYASPCGNLADCHPDSGTCNCPTNAKGSQDCLTCSPGWTGEDCSVAVVKSSARTSETIPVCQGYGGGHFTTFDGSSYNLPTAGEYYLVNKDNFAAQVRLVPCMNSTNCDAAISVRLGSVNMTLRAPYSRQGRPLLYINQKRTDYTQLHEIEGEFLLKQDQPNRFRISTRGRTILQARIQEKYISFSLLGESTTCWNASGLCSSCDNNTANDFVTSNRTGSTHGRKRKNIIEKFTSKWVVLPRDSMFVYKANEKREISPSRDCLKFRGTAVDTRVIRGSFTTSVRITIEFFVKVESFGGTILSYSSDKTSGIINDNTVKIQFSTNIYDTGVRLQIGEWYWLTISFNRLTKMLRFYCLDSNGLIRQTTLLVPHVLFTSGGTLSLGHWQTTVGGVTNVNREPFNGYIDELRVWNIFIEASAVRQSRNRIIKYKANGLIGLWLFDEGEGTIAHDTIGGHHFYFPVEPTARPEWKFSYARTGPPLQSSKISTWNNQSLRAEATEVCRRFILNSVNNANCGSKLGLAHSQFYYTSCLEDVKASGSINSAYLSIVGYTDYCQYYLNLPVWPLQRYCNLMPKELVTTLKGPNCNVSCLFGDMDSSGENCVCWKGYWGTNCSEICPGGAITPCNSHGKCSEETGKCECDYNWLGNEHCTRCTPGWHGENCNVASTTGNSSCVGFTGGHYQTFDGVRFSFLAAGEFKVIQSAGFVMHLRQVPCYDGKFRCVDGLAFLFDGSLRLVILASVPGTRQPVVWLDQTKLDINQKVVAVGSNYLLEQTSSTTSVLRSRDNRVIIKIRLIGKRLQFVAQVPRQVCLNSVALGGSCDGIRENDHNETAGMSLEELFGVLPGASLFSAVIGYKDFSTVITGSEYALKFDGIGVITDIIPDVFVGDYVTVELMYQTFEGNGTLFTYSKEMSFSVVLIEREFCLRTNGIISHTGIY